MVDRGTLDQCLLGISFPAGKEEIVECVTGNSCPQHVTTQLQSLRVGAFQSEEELLCQLGDSSYCS